MIVRAKKDIHQKKYDEYEHQSLSPGKEYFVLQINNLDFRVLDDQREPILYPKYLFDVVDSALPNGWSFCEFPGGQYYIGPIELNKPGFYEDYFDRVPEARKLFERVFASLLDRSTSE
jgi:hypothetical protein